MTMKSVYQKEMQEITHEPELDQVLYEEVEKTGKTAGGGNHSKNTGKRRKLAAAAIAIIILAGLNQATLTEAASRVIGYFTFSVGNGQEEEMAKINPRELDYDNFCQKNRVTVNSIGEHSYVGVFLYTAESFFEYTGIQYPENDEFEMAWFALDLGGNGIAHITIEIIRNGESCAILNGQFITTKASENAHLGYGNPDVRSKKVYTCPDGSKAYIVKNPEPNSFGTYFCKDDVQYQLLTLDKKSAIEIVDWLMQ